MLCSATGEQPHCYFLHFLCTLPFAFSISSTTLCIFFHNHSDSVPHSSFCMQPVQTHRVVELFSCTGVIPAAPYRTLSTSCGTLLVRAQTALRCLHMRPRAAAVKSNLISSLEGFLLWRQSAWQSSKLIPFLLVTPRWTSRILQTRHKTTMAADGEEKQHYY